MVTEAGLLGKIEILAIGSGWAAAARGLVAELGIDVEATRLRMLVDPAKHAYKYFKALRGVRRTFTWMIPENFAGFVRFPFECCIRWRLPNVNAGDPWQQGGCWLLAPSNNFDAGSDPEVLYECRETSPGWPRIDPAKFISALKAAGKIVEGQKSRSSVRSRPAAGRPQACSKSRLISDTQNK